MAMSAEAVVEYAATFTGIVHTRPVHIVLRYDDGEPIANAECKITFQDNSTMIIDSDNEGNIQFLTKAEIEFDIELLKTGACKETS